MSDYSFTCSVFVKSVEIISYHVPPPEDYNESNLLPDIRCTAARRTEFRFQSHSITFRPDSACITCVTDGAQVCVAAAWFVSTVTRHPEVFVRAFFVHEAGGELCSEEAFHARPLSLLHSVSCLSISCGATHNKLCLVGTRPSPPSSKHVTATEIIRMRKHGTPPTGPPTCVAVHSLSSQAVDDFNALRSELKKAREQRANAASFSGQLHAVGGSSTQCGVYAQFLRQSQWWQVCVRVMMIE